MNILNLNLNLKRKQNMDDLFSFAPPQTIYNSLITDLEKYMLSKKWFLSGATPPLPPLPPPPPRSILNEMFQHIPPCYLFPMSILSSPPSSPRPAITTPILSVPPSQPFSSVSPLPSPPCPLPPSPSNHKIPSTIQLTETKYTPHLPNTLFWSIYIHINGLDEFKNIQKGYSNIEMKLRMQIAEHIKENPHLIKQSNFKITQIRCKEMLSELFTETNLTMGILYLFALYYHMDIYLVNCQTHTYMKFTDKIGSSAPPCILYFTPPNLRQRGKTRLAPPTPIYSVELNTTAEDIHKIQTEYFYLESEHRPLLAISSYKVADLETILRALNITTDKPAKNKKEMYEMVWQHCIWAKN